MFLILIRYKYTQILKRYVPGGAGLLQATYLELMFEAHTEYLQDTG